MTRAQAHAAVGRGGPATPHPYREIFHFDMIYWSSQKLKLSLPLASEKWLWVLPIGAVPPPPLKKFLHTSLDSRRTIAWRATHIVINQALYVSVIMQIFRHEPHHFVTKWSERLVHVHVANVLSAPAQCNRLSAGDSRCFNAAPAAGTAACMM